MEISVAIACYEMWGKGDSFLQYSLDVLKNQEFKDFEVVISDHSEDDKIKQVCENNKELDIKYIKYEEKRGLPAANFNNCILHSSGKLIKVLCQDDYLFDSHSLEKIVNNFDYNRKWLVSSYYHTHSRDNLENLHIPEVRGNIYTENYIGAPTCLTILNEDPMLYDENLRWFFDCEYYYRLYKKYGDPLILSDPTAVQFLWDGQMTNSIITNQIINDEAKYVFALAGETQK